MIRMIAPIGVGPIKIFDVSGREVMYYPDFEGRFECRVEDVAEVRELGCQEDYS